MQTLLRTKRLAPLQGFNRSLRGAEESAGQAGKVEMGKQTTAEECRTFHLDVFPGHLPAGLSPGHFPFLNLRCTTFPQDGEHIAGGKSLRGKCPGDVRGRCPGERPGEMCVPPSKYAGQMPQTQVKVITAVLYSIL